MSDIILPSIATLFFQSSFSTYPLVDNLARYAAPGTEELYNYLVSQGWNSTIAYGIAGRKGITGLIILFIIHTLIQYTSILTFTYSSCESLPWLAALPFSATTAIFTTLIIFLFTETPLSFIYDTFMNIPSNFIPFFGPLLKRVVFFYILITIILIIRLIPLITVFLNDNCKLDPTVVNDALDKWENPLNVNENEF